MKGVVLAGGLGTRLAPLTDITNKHLLPVWDKPMIYYPLHMLRDIGINEILIVIGGKSTGEIVRLIGDGKQFGFKNVYYAYQYGEGGIAAALALAEHFVYGDRFCTVLGDNVIEKDLKNVIQDWKNTDTAAHIVLTKVENPSEFGCPIFDKWVGGLGEYTGKIVDIKEKPTDVQTNYIVSGIYFYSPAVFNVIRNQIPSKRGELEITDVNNWWAHMNRNSKDELFLSYSKLDGWWGDAGSSIEGLYEVSNMVKDLKIYA